MPTCIALSHPPGTGWGAIRGLRVPCAAALHPGAHWARGSERVALPRAFVALSLQRVHPSPRPFRLGGYSRSAACLRAAFFIPGVAGASERGPVPLLPFVALATFPSTARRCFLQPGLSSFPLLFAVLIIAVIKF